MLEPWEKIVNFTKDKWIPLRLSFSKFKGRRGVKAEMLKAEWAAANFLKMA